ncbi:MAG TPA: alpha-amylase family glycosyl hydrolase [Anaerolineaceae bacterium]
MGAQKHLQKLMAVLTVLTLIVTLLPTHSASADPSIWFVRGSFNGWAGEDNPLYDDGTHGDATAGDNIFTTEIPIATAGRYEFKVTTTDWSTNYPPENSWFVTQADGQVVTIFFDANTYADGWVPDTNRIGVLDSTAAWTAVGNWQGWENANPATAMTAAGDGTYSLTYAIPAAGTYEYKAVATGSWDAVGANGRNVNASTVLFTTVEAGQQATFSVNPLNGSVYVELEEVQPVPKPDDNVWWDGLGHNSRDTLYRVPQGAVTTGVPVYLRFRTYRNDVTGVTLRVWNTAAGAQSLYPMDLVATTDEDPFGYDYWQAQIPAQDVPTVLWYRFIVRDGSKEVYYEDNNLFDGAWGQTFEFSPDYSWQIDVYSPDFKTPDWMKNAVVYQIFPDRFFNGLKVNDPSAKRDGTVYGEEIIKKAWTDLPEGYCRGYQGLAEPCAENPMGRDFYGGDLAGVLAKLDYLKDLGVTAIYFNPIFEAPSNHKYDTSNYLQIDNNLGNTLQFALLAKAAEAKGIRLILDGVFNHTSSDSLYFDKYSQYPTVGAYESQDSKYYDWYTFSSWPDTYNSWWGFDTLPVLTETDEVKDFIYGSNYSVARTWIKMGADGWRLDVAPDKSHQWWAEFRPRVKSASSNAVIIGEIWDDASEWLLGDELDSTMNYRFRRAMLGFLVGGVNDPNQGDIIPLNVDQFDSVLQSIEEDYPRAAYLTTMNLVDSHDTQRILWALTPGARNREEREFNAANVAVGKDRLKLLAIMQMTMPGAPTVYYGDEVGLTGDTDPDDRRAFPWNSMDTSLRSHYKKLIAVRKAYSFLRTGSFDRLYTHNDNGTYAYGRKDASGAALIAVNNSGSAHELVIPVQGYLPEGSVLTDKLNGGQYTVSGGTVTLTVNAMWGAVLVTKPGIDLKPPAAPTGLAAADEDGQVRLSWNAVSGAAAYRVYRSPVTAGGYSSLFDVTTTEVIDTSVVNGRRYYYVVTALDAAGNESAYSNEIEALPHMLIGWANLQWPPTLTTVISAVNPTADIYGQVWIDGRTAQPGVTPGLIAQVGYGPEGSDPAAGGWLWVNAVFNVDAGNNDEFKASLLPQAVGVFDYVYRYSTTGGREWLYADLNGPVAAGQLPANPGKLTVEASADVTPPSVPANLRVSTASNSFLSLAWDASLDVDGAVYRYEIFRSDASGGPYTQIGAVNAPALEFTDWTVTANSTYFYVVLAVDTSFNRSDFSAELEASAVARPVAVTFNVTVPDSTAATGLPVYIAGNFNGWNPGGTVMTQVDATHWTITLNLDEGYVMEYKYTLGSWDYVEKDAACGEISNRKVTIYYGAAGTQEQVDIVPAWRNVSPCGN